MRQRPNRAAVLRFDKQPSFELGVIAFEMGAGCHFKFIEVYIRVRVTAERNTTGYAAEDLVPSARTHRSDSLARLLQPRYAAALYAL
jgi:hypothetical protein